MTFGYNIVLALRTMSQEMNLQAVISKWLVRSATLITSLLFLKGAIEPNADNIMILMRDVCLVALQKGSIQWLA